GIEWDDIEEIEMSYKTCETLERRAMETFIREKGLYAEYIMEFEIPAYNGLAAAMNLFNDIRKRSEANMNDIVEEVLAQDE
ncbi:MAG: hypothetical protein ACXADS_12570, partial [Candidatus Thorarchaeota archaeon]